MRFAPTRECFRGMELALNHMRCGAIWRGKWKLVGNLSGIHLVAILVIVLLLFGAPKLPALAKSLGQSMRILKKEVSGDDERPESPAQRSDPTVQRDASRDDNSPQS